MEFVGVENNMAALNKELYIVVTEQDTGENIIFGEDYWPNNKTADATGSIFLYRMFPSNFLI